MKKIIFIAIVIISFTFCKEKSSLVAPNKTYTFSGNVYALINSQKVYLENVKVIFEIDTVITDTLGFFSFKYIENGEYSLKFLYSITSDSIMSKVVDFEIKDDDKFQEFLLYEKEFLNEGIVNEAFIYIKSDNYYLRNKNGEVFQITYTNDKIIDEVAFFNDRNRFIYISIAGENHFSINLINLNPLYHKVIYEADAQLQDLRISADETNIYFFENNKIIRLDVNSEEKELLYDVPDNRTKVLFHDCKRFAYSYGTKFQQEYVVIKSFITGDSTETGGSEFPVYVLRVSPNDEFLYQQTSIDGAASGILIDINSSELYIHGIYGKGWGRFSDDGKYFFGIDGEAWDDAYSAAFIDLVSKKKFVIEESLDIESTYDPNLKVGFNTLSYSKSENKLLYSLLGDIKIYSLNIQESFDFLVSDQDEHGARFINID